MIKFLVPKQLCYGYTLTVFPTRKLYFSVFKERLEREVIALISMGKSLWWLKMSVLVSSWPSQRTFSLILKNSSGTRPYHKDRTLPINIPNTILQGHLVTIIVDPGT